MHTKKTILAALLGLSLFVLGLAVGQGWFTPQPARAQFGGNFVSMLQATASPSTYNYLALSADGDLYSFDTGKAYPITTLGEVRYLGNISSGVIPTGQESVGGLKGSYDR